MQSGKDDKISKLSKIQGQLPPINDKLFLGQLAPNEERGYEAGYLQPDFDRIYGGGDNDGPTCQVNSESLPFGQFLLDSEVCCKARISTFRSFKKWNKHEDMALKEAVRKYK